MGMRVWQGRVQGECNAVSMLESIFRDSLCPALEERQALVDAGLGLNSAPPRRGLQVRQEGDKREDMHRFRGAGRDMIPWTGLCPIPMPTVSDSRRMRERAS